MDLTPRLDQIPMNFQNRQPLGPRRDLTAGACAFAIAGIAINAVRPDDSVSTVPLLLDLAVSLWATIWVGAFAAISIGSVNPGVRGLFGSDTRLFEQDPPSGPSSFRSGKRVWGFAILLALICVAEWGTHGGARNGFLASSRPEAGMEDWTAADGYATVLDGHPAQGDGLFLLNLVGLFTAERPAISGEFDRRAGHVWLASLLHRPFGSYWAFALVNLAGWYASAIGVWWLGRRRWPQTWTGELAALMVATGQGFIFMSTAPQAHPAAFGAFVIGLMVFDHLNLWSVVQTRREQWAAILGSAWMTGIAGLLYFGHIPLLLTTWIFGGPRMRVQPLLAVSAGALAIVTAWQVVGENLLGLRFSGGNNDLAGGAIRIWLRIISEGAWSLRWQFHAGSIRGLLVGAFYYPWWILAIIGIFASPRRSRTWALCILAGTLLPAIAFAPQFRLPRAAYFAFPAVYLLAGAALYMISQAIATRFATRSDHWRTAAGLVACAVVIAGLATLTNLDLTGDQTFNVWFHEAQGNSW
ncbi:MAG: hypothetical protein EXR45_02490 [Chloroflexi bacterium]|nr:hypothetical protein [Chloroflexota bacterium]